LAAFRCTQVLNYRRAFSVRAIEHYRLIVSHLLRSFVTTLF
jgi:hypothetical protein